MTPDAQLAVCVDLADSELAARATYALVEAGFAIRSESATITVTDSNKAVASLDGCVVVVASADRRVLARLLSAGAAGVVLAAAIEDSLPAVLQTVRLGYVVVPAEAREAMRRPLLTARQQQIVSLVVLGLSNADIGKRLHLSESTVKTHLSGVFDQLGVRTRREVIDTVLDPASGLGLGIIGATSQPKAAGDAYTRPTIRS